MPKDIVNGSWMTVSEIEKNYGKALKILEKYDNILSRDILIPCSIVGMGPETKRR